MGEHDGDSACAQCGHEKRVHYFHHRHGPRHPDRGMPVHCDGIDAGYAWSECLCPGFYPAPPDPRDAEIARLKAEVERLAYELAIVRRNLDCARDDHDADLARHKRALAAGLAALRKVTDDYDGAAEMVEAAQEAAMKEKS